MTQRVNELRLVTELVGGPYDGREWSSDWVPHWCQRITWGERKAGVASIRWAEYELKDSRVAWHTGQPCVYFSYHFVGYREWFPSWCSRLVTKLSRWGKQLYARLWPPPAGDPQQPVSRSSQASRGVPP
jgi:hypothetical protein